MLRSGSLGESRPSAGSSLCGPRARDPRGRVEKLWLESHAAEFEQDDPPAPCKLTDLSLGGCYLETGSPFPLRTRIILSMQVAGQPLRAEAVVLVMHPDLGMGVEFTQATDQQRDHVEKFIHALTNRQRCPPRDSGGTGRPGDYRTGQRPPTPEAAPKILCSSSFEGGPNSRPKPSNPNSANSETPRPKSQPTRRRSR